MRRRAIAAWLLSVCLPAAALDADAQAGRKVFRTYCVACHGSDATGCGIKARLYQPPPANLTASTVPPEYKAAIIRRGGEAMGRSPFMPPWGDELRAEQITQVVAYLGTLVPKAARC